MSTKKYNVGIIGYGWAATAHIDAINKTSQAQVTAIYSSRPLDSATLSAKHGGKIKAYQSVEAMLADPDIHVVDITSYPSQHCAQAGGDPGQHPGDFGELPARFRGKGRQVAAETARPAVDIGAFSLDPGAAPLARDASDQVLAQPQMGLQAATGEAQRAGT